jgi:hypothetical protein
MLILLMAASPARADDNFDRHTAFWLETATRDAEPIAALTSGQAARLETLGPGVESPCIVVRTADGNIAKALITWGLRKHDPEPIPVCLIERFVTYDGTRRDIAIAHGENVMLFPGFRFDFDLGQVVPDGYGEDLTLDVENHIAALGDAKLYALDGSGLPAAEEGEHDPNASKDIATADFAGTWKLNADGRWQGDLRLSVDDGGNVTGQFTSDETKSVYPLGGRIIDTHRLQFTIQFANTDQDFDLYLRTTDKSVLAGTTTLLQRTFGAVAERETQQ